MPGFDHSLAVGRAAKAVIKVRLDVQMREQQIVLEHVAEPPTLRRHVDAALTVEERGLVDDDAAPLRPGDAGERVDKTGLARSRSPEKAHDRSLGTKCHFQPEAAQLASDVDVDHSRAARCGRRATHSAATSAARDKATAIALSRQADASPPGTCVNV